MRILTFYGKIRKSAHKNTSFFRHHQTKRQKSANFLLFREASGFCLQIRSICMIRVQKTVNNTTKIPSEMPQKYQIISIYSTLSLYIQ